MSAVSTISPSALLKELDSLWLNLGKDADNTDHTNAVLCACAMTLIAVVEGEAQEIGETLALLMRDHPSRLIVVTVDESGEPRLEDEKGRRRADRGGRLQGEARLFGRSSATPNRDEDERNRSECEASQWTQNAPDTVS